MLKPILPFTAFFAAFFAPSPLAQNPIQLLADLENSPTPVASSPGPGAEINGTCVFAATTQAHGRELWHTTPNGPQLLKDIFPGVLSGNPTGFTVFQGRVWFAANDGVSGTELWATDGTAAGTVLVANLEPGIEGSSPRGFTVCGNRMFFSAFEGGAGHEPHVTDGTAAGTVFVKDVRPGRKGSEFNGSHQFTCCGNQVLFFADNGTAGGELHKSDGTAAGTQMVVDLRPGTRSGIDSAARPVCCNGKLFFSGDNGATGFEPFVSDGTAAGTLLLASLRPGASSSSPLEFTCLNNLVLFAATNTANGRELFRSDGTPAGTSLLADILPGTDSSFPAAFARLGNVVVFGAVDPNLGRELFSTDGTTAGTGLLADLRPGLPSSFPDKLVTSGNRIFFTSQTVDGNDPFVTDGTAAGTFRLMDVFPGQTGLQPDALTACSTGVVMQAPTPAGAELLQSDGTVAGTVVHDLEPAQTNGSSDPREITPIDAVRFYFIATTVATGLEVFFFDGQTATVREVTPGANGSSPQRLVAVGDTVYWSAFTAATGTELFRSTNGGPAQLVQDLRPGSTSSSPSELVALDGDTLLFAASTTLGTELCEVQNGVAGITVHDIRPTGSSSPSGLSRIRDAVTGTPVVVFAANDGTHGSEPYVFEAGAAHLVADINPGTGSSSPAQFAVSRDGFVLVFTAFDGQGTLVQRLLYDSTTDVFPMLTLADLSTSFIAGLMVAGDLQSLLQVAMVLTENGFAQNGTEVHVVDSATNTQTVIDTFPGPEGSDPDDLMIGDDDTVFYTADDGQHGRELVTYNPTTQAMQVHDTRPGFESATYGGLLQAAGFVIGNASPLADGQKQLVRIDANGPQVLQAQNFQNANAVGNQFAFNGQNGSNGNELMGHRGTGGNSVELGYACNSDAHHSVSTPTLGSLFAMRAIGGPANALGVMLLDVSPTGVPTLFFGCPAWFDPQDVIVVAVALSPQMVVNIALPSDPALADNFFTSQAAWINFSLSASTFASNGMISIFGL